jgi:hypothetical protein
MGQPKITPMSYSLKAKALSLKRIIILFLEIIPLPGCSRWRSYSVAIIPHSNIILSGMVISSYVGLGAQTLQTLDEELYLTNTAGIMRYVSRRTAHIHMYPYKKERITGDLLYSTWHVTEICTPSSKYERETRS